MALVSYTLISATIIRQLLAACPTSPFFSEIGLGLGDAPIQTDSEQCRGAWVDGLTCLTNPDEFTSKVEAFMSSLNAGRRLLRAKTLEYYDELVHTRITDDNRSLIFDESTRMLLPHNPSDAKFKFSVTFEHCFEDINLHMVKFMCYITSDRASEHFDSSAQLLDISESYVYDMLKNCLEMAKTFCLFLKYYEFVFTPRIGAEAVAQLFGSYTRYCSNTLTFCASNYSSEWCPRDFKLSIVSGLFNFRGIGNATVVLALLLHVFEGQELNLNAPTPSTVILNVSDEGFYGKVVVNDINYSIGKDSRAFKPAIALWTLGLLANRL